MCSYGLLSSDPQECYVYYSCPIVSFAYFCCGCFGAGHLEKHMVKKGTNVNQCITINTGTKFTTRRMFVVTLH